MLEGGKGLGSVGGGGGGYGREMYVGEMVTVLVVQARREGQREVTYSIQLSVQLSLRRWWAKPIAPAFPLSCSLDGGRKGSEEGSLSSCEEEGPASVGSQLLGVHF